MDMWNLTEGACTWTSPEVKEQYKIQLLGRCLPYSVERLIIRESAKQYNSLYPPSFEAMAELAKQVDQELTERQADAAKAREAAVGDKRPQPDGASGSRPNKFKKPFGKPGGKPTGKPGPQGPGKSQGGPANAHNKRGGQSYGKPPHGKRPGGYKGKDKKDGKKPFDGKDKSKDKKE
jgi:hypothetical protein